MKYNCMVFVLQASGTNPIFSSDDTAIIMTVDGRQYPVGIVLGCMGSEMYILIKGFSYNYYECGWKAVSSRYSLGLYGV